MYVLALRGFTSIRGWPNLVYSDPDKELKQVWMEVDKRAVLKCSTKAVNGFLGRKVGYQMKGQK